MWAKLAGLFIKYVIGGIIQAWESQKRDATNIEKGADKVIKGQLEDGIKKAKRAQEISDETRRATDDDLDSGMRSNNRRSNRNKK